MKLLQFEMPPSARIAWVSEGARSTWEPRIAAAASAYYRLELETVRAGIRACTTRHMSPDRMELEYRALTRQGLMFLPMRRVGSYSGFAHRHPPVIAGQKWNYYGCVAARPEDAEAFADASDRNDHVRIAELLGYPKCCSAFFSDVWARGYVDPIWQAAERTGRAIEGAYQDHADIGHVLCDGKYVLDVSHSIIWDGLRYIGIRIAPHLPCSYDCAASLDMAHQWIALGRELQIPGLDDLLNLLSMPCEWDCLKGIALISTPIFRISTNSMPCYPRYVVRKMGDFYPEESARGLQFPWNKSAA